MDAVSPGSLGSPLSSTDLLQVQGTAGYADRGTVIGRQTSPCWKQPWGSMAFLNTKSGIFLTSLVCFIYSIWATPKPSIKKKKSVIWQTPCELLKHFSFERKTSRNFCQFAWNCHSLLSYFYQRGKLDKSLNKEIGLHSFVEHGEAQV